MPQDIQDRPPVYLTTREVADLLRVKERKVYDLAAAGDIPCRRITGKLLFPNAEIRAWIDGNSRDISRERPAVLTGSHDPLLDWAARESDSGLAILLNGSLEGLRCFKEEQAALAGMHFPEKTGWNVETVTGQGLRDCVLVAWAIRSRGLALSDQVRGKVKKFSDLRGRRVALRQPGAGATTLFEMLLKQHDIVPGDVAAPTELARTESDAAAAVAAGEADAALSIEAMARRFHLGFVPLVNERFDLLIDRCAYFTPPIQRLFAFAQGECLRAKAASMGGYDVSNLGSVRWLSP